MNEEKGFQGKMLAWVREEGAIDQPCMTSLQSGSAGGVGRGC